MCRINVTVSLDLPLVIYLFLSCLSDLRLRKGLTLGHSELNY